MREHHALTVKVGFVFRIIDEVFAGAANQDLVKYLSAHLFIYLVNSGCQHPIVFCAESAAHSCFVTLNPGLEQNVEIADAIDVRVACILK